MIFTTNLYKKLVYLPLLFLATLLLVSCDNPKNRAKIPPIKDGQLKLTGWPFQNDRAIPLQGEWKFKWSEDNPDYALTEFDDSSWETIELPSYWNKHTGVGIGFAWYRLKIIFDDINSLAKIDQMGLYLNNVHSSYSLYVNGIKIMSNGIAANNKSQTISQNLPKASPIPPIDPSKPLVVAIKVSNFHHARGGAINVPYLSTFTGAQKILTNNNLRDWIVLGILLMMSIYHFVLWLARREDKGSFYFAVFCLLIFFRLCSTNRLAEMIFPHSDIFQLRFKVEYLCMPLGWALFSTFIRQLFKDEFHIKILVFFQLITIPFIFITLLFSAETYSQYTFVFLGATFLCMVWVIYSMIKATLRRRFGAGLVTIGVMFLVVTVLNDILHTQEIIHTGYFTHLGLVFFIFAQSAVIAMRFAKAYHRGERLNLALNSANLKLENAFNLIKEQERARTIFFHNTSHELRTPLNGIIGFLDLITSGHYGQAASPIANQVKKITSLAHSLKHQVNTILDLAKSKRGELVLAPARVDLREIVEESRVLAEGLMMKKDNVSFTLEHSWPIEQDGQSEPQCFLVTDREKVLTILRNLLGNAFKFARTDQHNQIKLYFDLTDNEKLKLQISDTGIGIPESQQDKIFDEFKQVDDDSRRSFEGTGLGLALVNKIVDLISGTIKLNSTEGVGSTFTIELPAIKSQEVILPQKEKIPEISVTPQAISKTGDSAESEKTVPISQEAPGTIETDQNIILAKEKENNSQYTIMVVDDNEINVEVFSELLNSRGYQVVESFGGRDALTKIKDDPPDLVLLDLMMPDVSGEDVLTELKNTEQLADLPVIIITARASQEDRIFGLELGADDYLAKPVIGNELLLRVKTLINRIELTDKIARAEEMVIHREKMAQLGEMLSYLSHELKNIYTAIGIGMPRARVQIENLILSLSPENLQWNGVLEAIFISSSLPAFKQNQRKSQLKTIGQNPNIDKQRKMEMIFLLSRLDTEDSDIVQLFEQLNQEDKMVFNNLADIMGLARSFANMRHSSQTAHTLMMSALNHVREKGDMENKTELNQVINSCLTLLDKKLSVSQINLRIDLPEQVMLKIHSGQLHQIILNLLLNAHDAFQHDKNSGRTRYIKIDFVSENSNGIVSVEDNGSGIPEEIKETIFERFYSTKGKKGSGIGLFVSKRLAEKNQGQLTVKSQPGKTVFKLNLPLGGLQK